MMSETAHLSKQPQLVPLTYTQRNLWFLQKLVPDATDFNMCKAWRISGDIDVAALRRAIVLLLTRHQTLRTCVRLVGGEPVQSVPETVPDVLEYGDFRARPEADEGQAVEALIFEETRKSIDLENGPVFSAKLLRVKDREYVFFFVTHHIFIDGWSIAILTRDLSKVYNVLRLGREPDLPALPINYTEFARAQMASTDTLRSDLDYWQKALAGAPSLLELPTDLTRPVMQLYRGGRLPFEVGAARTRALKTLARGHRVTVFMVLLSVFKVLLFRFSGQTDICVGTLFANRSTSNVENLVGLCLNTLVIRSHLGDGPVFGEFLACVRGRLLEAFRYASTPLDRIIEQLRPSRDPGYNPLFQVMFIFQNTPPCALELDSLTTRDLSVAGSSNLAHGIGVSRFDLSLTIAEQDEMLKCSLEYNTDLFVEDTARNLCQCFERLLESVCEYPDQSIDRLPLLNPAERHDIVSDWNQTDFPLDPSATVQGSFAEQVRSKPDAIALVDASGPVRFGELDRWSRRVAAMLRARNVRPGDVVAVVAEPSAAWVAAFLGALRIGAIVLPLDSAFPKPRLRAFMKESGARVVVASAQAPTPGEGLGAEAIEMPGMAGTDEVADLYEPGITETHETAYIMFTSGSTGSPRAVAGTHIGIINRCGWMARQFPYEEGEFCCHHTSPAFVDVIAEVFGPLFCGVPAVVLDRQARSDPAVLISHLEDHCVSRISLTPTLLRSMLDVRGGIRGLRRLSIWISSGEILAPDLCLRFFDQLPNATLLNVYGSTEVAADATWFDCTRARLARRTPVGRPIDNVKTYILDPLLQPVPTGFQGELYVGGVGVAHGYWRQEAATKKKFLIDPVDSGTGKIFRTGDLARYRNDGNIDILGRADGQIKLHGIRIAVEEIEAHLNLHPDVRTTTVGLWQDTRGETFLVAWCVPEPGRVIEARRLRRHLSHQLPRQWIPSYYVPVDVLPRLASGKVDRRALADPRTPDVVVTRTPGESMDEVEQKLYAIWAELLQFGSADRNDDFFDLGGHSMLVFQLLDRIETAFGVRLQVGTVFLAPTIAELSDQIRQTVVKVHPQVIVKIRDRSGTPLFCIPAAATSVLSLRALCLRFEKEQSFFAFESYGLIAGTEPQHNIEEMARIYIDAVRLNQPRGPYCIAGRCFGGVVAFEMARQFAQAGDRVALLALIETAVPLFNRECTLASLQPAERQRLESLYTTDRARGRQAQTGIEAKFELSISAAPVAIQGMIRAADCAHRKALRTYVPTPIDVPITVFRSRVGRWGERAGWDLFARGGYRCAEFDGDNDSMFEAPRVYALSAALGAALKQAVIKDPSS